MPTKPVASRRVASRRFLGHSFDKSLLSTEMEFTVPCDAPDSLLGTFATHRGEERMGKAVGLVRTGGRREDESENENSAFLPFQFSRLSPRLADCRRLINSTGTFSNRSPSLFLSPLRPLSRSNPRGIALGVPSCCSSSNFSKSRTFRVICLRSPDSFACRTRNETAGPSRGK